MTEQPFQKVNHFWTIILVAPKPGRILVAKVRQVQHLKHLMFVLANLEIFEGILPRGKGTACCDKPARNSTDFCVVCTVPVWISMP
eukprot:s1200_g30.t1